MRTTLVINHPHNNGVENKKLETAIGDETHITHMSLTGFTKERIKSLSESCDVLLFFHTTMEKIHHLIDKKDPSLNNIRKISPSSKLGEYKLVTL